MPFWLLLLLFVATTVVGALLAPHPTGPQPSALGDFNIPTAEEGRAIPVVFGTVMIKGGNTVWWGDLRTKKISSGLLATIMSFGRSTTIGFEYYLGCQFALCQGPVDALVQIQADVKAVSYTDTLITNGSGSENYHQLFVNSPKLFGGEAPGGAGGLKGFINFYRGLQTQQPDDYLSAVQGRVALTQSGLPYTFAGVGNGTMTGVSGGAGSKNETITVTAIGIDTNVLHSTFNKMKFSVVGSVTGPMTNAVGNAEGSHACWADAAFSNGGGGGVNVINFTIDTGTTQFAIGDTFTIVTQHSHTAPAYRGLCYAVFKQLYVGTSSYLKPLAFVVQRCPDGLGLGPSVANINGDANAAEMIYDLLTNIGYGLGIPPSTIDVAGSFTSAAQTLATEGLGISMQFDTQASADNLISEILRHVDGLLYTDPATGLWTLKLARADYNPATLPVLTVDSVIGTPDSSRSSWSETTNLVGITFLSAADNWNERIVRNYDLANISVTGEVRPQTIQFKGISKETTAGLVATRVLKTLTYPLSKIKIVANRSAWNFRPGGVFRFTWTPLGISNQVFRITRIGYGELTDGKITIDAVEDIFGINATAFTPPPVSGWVNPVGAPQALAAQQLIELPYHVSQLGRFVLAMAAHGIGSVTDYQIWLNEGSGDFESAVVDGFTPIGLLAAAYGANTPALDATGFSLQLSGQVDLDFLASVNPQDVINGLNLLLVDQEFMSWQTVTANSDGTYTISGILRGVMDTVPVNHAAGAIVWFVNDGTGTTKMAPYPADLTVSAKLLPENSFGVYPITSASYDTLATNSRAARPYPPGDLTMQSQAYGTRFASTLGDLFVAWQSRNRLTQTAALTLVRQDAPDIAGETGQTFKVVVQLAGVTIRTVTGITTPENYTYTAVQRQTDDGDGTKAVTLEIFSNANALDSYMPNQLTATMSGFGLAFGSFFGGLQQ